MRWNSGKAHRHDIGEIRKFKRFLNEVASGKSSQAAYAEIYGETIYENSHLIASSPHVTDTKTSS